mgnify:CR=1 FL=1
MRRRDFIVLAGSATTATRAAFAQTSGKPLRVATVNVQARTSPNWVAFERRMAERGWIEGNNFVFDYVQLPNPDAWAVLYGEAVERKPDIVIAAGPEQSLQAARSAAGSLPIVMIAVDYDPIARGYVASLAKPGGTITGVYFQNSELASKHLALTKELMPDISTAAVLWDRHSVDYWRALQAAAPQHGVMLAGIELTKPPYDYGAALSSLPPADRRFLIAQSSPFFFRDRAELVEAVGKVASGGAYVTASLAEQVVLRLNGALEAPAHSQLSDREFDVLRRIVAGQRLTDIADALHLSVKTVSTHKRRIQDKLQLPTTASLIRYGMEQGLRTEDSLSGT